MHKRNGEKGNQRVKPSSSNTSIEENERKKKKDVDYEEEEEEKDYVNKSNYTLPETKYANENEYKF